MSCPDCYSGHKHEGTPRGKIIKLHGLNAYVVEPTKEGPVKGIIVIIPDAFGWEFVNNKILADHYADKSDYRVYLPDFMKGHSAPVWMLDSMAKVMGPKSTLFSKLTGIPGLAFGFGSFIFHNRPVKSYPVVKAFFSALREAEPDLPIGAAGFCWGGKHVALMSTGEDRAGNDKPLLDAGFTGHPSLLDMPVDIEKIRLPVSFALAVNDHNLKPDEQNTIKRIVEAQPEEQRGEVVIHQDCGHGFCIRADITNDECAKQAADAEDQCLRWFQAKFPPVAAA